MRGRTASASLCKVTGSVSTARARGSRRLRPSRSGPEVRPGVPAATCRGRHALRHRPERTYASLGMSRDAIRCELVRVDDLDPGVGEDRRCVEASPGVVGDNRVSLPKDDSVRDVAVIRVVQPIVVVPILWSLDLRAGEGALHLVEQTAAVFLAVPPSPLRIESRQHVVQLEGDAGAPEWRVSLLGCE